MNWLSEHLSAHGTALSGGDLVKLGVLIAFDALLIFSVVSFAIVTERALALSRARKLEESEYAILRDGWRQNSALLPERLAQSEAPSARAVQNGVALMGDLQNPRSRSAQTAQTSHTNARELAREAVTQGLDVESARLGRNLSILATVASTAPYIGLFGTVLGILSAFARIAATGQTGASAVAAPIAEALTATGLGLGVAIPAVMAYNFLSGRVGDLMLRVETHALDLSARLIGSAAPQSPQPPQPPLAPEPPQVLAVAPAPLANGAGGAGVELGKASPSTSSTLGSLGGGGDAH